MEGDTNIAALGALLSDPGRCRVLLALGDGRALPASVLASEAGVAFSMASEHLRKLLDARLLRVETHGRHRYYRLAGPHVARLLETLAQYAPTVPVRSLKEGTRAHAVRQARCCYDHLGGRLAVGLMDPLLEREVIAGGDGRFDPAQAREDRLAAPGHDVDYRLMEHGVRWLRDFGVDVDAVCSRRRPLIRYCLDWSEQRHHLAGALGAAVARVLFERGWLEPAPYSRAVRVTKLGDCALKTQLGLVLNDQR
ncbi:MAG: ArsR/SmtB family transcription factor [Solirubrobacteraceae bacterium]